MLRKEVVEREDKVKKNVGKVDWRHMKREDVE